MSREGKIKLQGKGKPSSEEAKRRRTAERVCAARGKGGREGGSGTGGRPPSVFLSCFLTFPAAPRPLENLHFPRNKGKNNVKLAKT